MNWKKNWKYYLGGFFLLVIAAFLVWHYMIKPPYSGLPCIDNQAKWDFFKQWVRQTHNEGNEGENPDWEKWTLNSLGKPHYSRDEKEKGNLCDLARQHLFLNAWEEHRAMNGLDKNGKKLKEGQKWAYRGPIDCLQGFGWDRYKWIKDCWVELSTGLSMKNKSGGRADEVDGALWLWESAGNKEWAKSFGSDTHTVETLCNRLKGLTEDGSQPSFFPDLISYTEGVEDFNSLSLPPEMGGGIFGTYSATPGYKQTFSGKGGGNGSGSSAYEPIDDGGNIYDPSA